MDNLREMIETVRRLGYENEADIRARVCQDLVLEAITKSSLSRNVTIKGGVVMRSITGNIRRATQDMDIDFIRYSLANDSIDRFVDTLNCIDGISFERTGEIENGFYGAPTVIAIFSQGNFLFKTADAFCMAENIVLQATELGIASCIISRGEETFDSEEGWALMKEWGVPDNYICQGFVVLGYIDGEQPVSKPRKPGRVQIIE